MATTIHDSGYKKLFSNRTIFRQLIQTFVPEPWVNDIDFEQAETLDKSFISDHYKETESDLIYKVKFNGREAYLFVLLEFQSTVDRFMALRMLNYLTNFYMDYVASSHDVQYLPPVFPIVLYNGDKRWTAPVKLETLIRDVGLLGKYGVRFQYFKSVEHEYPKDRLLKIHNIVSTLFLAEAYYDRALLIEELAQVFADEADQEAALLFLNWFRQLRMHGRIPATDFQEFEHVYQDVREVKSMLVKAIEQEHQQWLYEGMEKGREKGREEGLINGMLNGIDVVVAEKFGEAGAPLIADIAKIHDVAALREVLEVIIRESALERVKAFVAVKDGALRN